MTAEIKFDIVNPNIDNGGLRVKKIAFFTALSLFSMATVAATTPFVSAPAPEQVYHSASDTNTANTAPQPVAAMQTAAQQVAQLSGASTAALAPQPPTPIIANGAALNADALAAGQAAQASQDNLTFQQQASQRLTNLEDSNRAMSSAVMNINQNIAVLQQQMTTLNSARAGSEQHDFLTFMTKAGDAGYLNLMAAAVILLGSGMMIGRLLRRDNPSAQSIKNADDTNTEYDFMATTEAIPAKLDLARSYMAMGNYEDARLALKVALQKGNEEQRMVAESLMHKINKIKIGA